MHVRAFSSAAPSRRHGHRLARALALTGALAVGTGSLGTGAAAVFTGSAGTAGAAVQRSASARATAHGSGPVDVLYAGSLVTLMQTSLDAAFHRATGYTVTGISAGSTALASEIKGGVRVADVFVSAASRSDVALEGRANGNWVSWYATVATSPLLLGYNPSSAFAAALRSKPWWSVVTRPGFQVGRTNPVTDPKGVLTVKAVDETANKEHDPRLRSIVATTADVFPEQAMVGRLQSGQLDAGFFYGVEAAAAKLPTVPLKGVDLHAVFTVTVVAHAPHPAGADAFVRFLLGAEGRSLLDKNGMRGLAHPEVRGKRSAVPKGLQKAFGR